MKKINKNSIVSLTVLAVAFVFGLAGSTALFAATPTPVDLLSAGNFVILSKTGITNVPTSAITGNVGTSPITGAAITGLDCVEVTGTVYTVDATGPACRVTDATLLTTAVLDMEAAYTAAAGVPAGVGAFLNVGAGTVTGLTLIPGTYTWGSTVTIPTDLTLDAQGDANAVWIFQITGTLDLAAGKQVILAGGAQAKNIFWQVADVVSLGAGSHFEGTILAKTNIAMVTGATLNGRMLAQTAVTLQSNVVSVPVSVPVPVLADVSFLTAAKASAQGLITANAVESTTPGDHVVGSLSILTSAEAAANGTNASAQAVVDAQVVTLNAAIAAYNAAIVLAAPVSAPVDLLSAGNFVILSKTGITNVPTSAITGNVGTSPITGAAITGLDCVEVTGTVYTVDATGPACRVTDATLLTTAVLDMEAAYTAAAGVPAGVGAFLNVGAGTVTGLTLIPGTYTWGSTVTIPTDLTLDAQGDANAVWIFQITGTLDLAAGKQVILAGGAQAKNIFWQVADVVSLGAGSHFEGTILAKTNIAMVTGATLNGRALAQTAVTLDQNTLTIPAK